jgi:hypothetical protein
MGQRYRNARQPPSIPELGLAEWGIAVRSILKVFTASALLALVVAGCAQDPKSVVISVGRGYNMPSDGVIPDGNEARDYAALYLPYARMARLAYVDRQYRNADGCPELSKLKNTTLEEEKGQAKEHLLLHAQLTELNKHSTWRCKHGWYGVAPYMDGLEPAPGFAAYVWTNGCKVAVVFRGTDPKELADWQANLRGLLPITTRKDQYDHVHWSIAQMIAKAKVPCARRVVMVGHSLGAGLAQAAAFVTPGTEYVFAFDSSPITSLLELDEPEARLNQERLAIDRIYEVGEVLQAVRFVMHGFVNPRVCHPRVRLVRFNMTPGFNPFKQHKLEGLIDSFVRVAGNNPATLEVKKRVSGRKKALNCDFSDEVFRDDSIRYPRSSVMR